MTQQWMFDPATTNNDGERGLSRYFEQILMWCLERRTFLDFIKRSDAISDLADFRKDNTGQS